MTSNDTSQYSYFVSYAHSRGHGFIQVTTTAPITDFDTVKQVNQIVSDNCGEDAAALTGWQLLSGPAEAAPVGLPGLYTRIADTVADAQRQLADETTDRQYLAESLVDTLTQVRDLLAATLPRK